MDCTVQESLERLAEQYSDLLTRNITISSTTTEYLEKLTGSTCMELDQNPTPEEFNKTTKEAKSHKNGTDHFPVEILNYTSSKLLKPVIFQLILQTWENTQIPDSFLQLIMCSIFKKSNKRICENQNGIFLMSHLC